MKEFWNIEINNICEGVIFKVKQINPIELITLLSDNLEYDKATVARKLDFNKFCLKQFIFTKTGIEWYPLIDEDGNPRLAELSSNPTIAFDLFFWFRREVLNPVFTESKTFQDLIPVKKGSTSKTK